MCLGYLVIYYIKGIKFIKYDYPLYHDLLIYDRPYYFFYYDVKLN